MAALGDIGKLVDTIIKYKTPGFLITVPSVPSLLVNTQSINKFWVNVNDDTQIGDITGTVTVSAVPKRQLVILMESNSPLVVRSTYSDATTGAFIFENLNINQTYTVVVKDINRVYADEIRSMKIPV